MKVASNLLIGYNFFKVYVSSEDIPPINFIVMTNCALFPFSYAVITITYLHH